MMELDKISMDNILVKIKKVDTNIIKGENITLEFGKVREETWEEKEGPQIKPNVFTLRNWDFKLLSRYKPFYSPLCDFCCKCVFGKCDLSEGKKGACGIDMTTQQAREFCLHVTIGTACHLAHARHMVDYLIKKLGRDYKINLGLEINVEAPITRTIIGIKPEVLGDLDEALRYAEEEVTNVLASIATGQEASAIDYESKALHMGMIDNLVKEIADIAQIVGYNYPKGDEDAPLAEIGMGVVDTRKATILTIGHNAIVGIEILDYIDKNNLNDKVEVVGICCTSHDLVRKNSRVKIIGPMSAQLRFLRAGIADVIVIDEQCIRTDVVEEARKRKSFVIATSDKACHGLEDRTNDPADKIIMDLISNGKAGVLIHDPKKAAEVAVKLAMLVNPLRYEYKRLPDINEVIEDLKKCTKCYNCQRNCPVNLEIPEAIEKAKHGNLFELSIIREECIACGRCESSCPKDIKIVTAMEKAVEYIVKNEKSKIRAGRGPIKDTEIRKVGQPIVFGEIPGVILFAGCSNYYNGTRELGEMAEEFLKRNYIVVTSGCAAMTIASYKDEEGKSLYEKYPGSFDAGCLVNLGSCVANSHAIGAAIKIANIFARRPLRGNFEVIADYILNRVGAVAVVWGTMSQKAIAIATGANRWGIPVILGPHGAKYRRLLLGRRDKENDWIVYDARTGKRVVADPVPEHLLVVAESKEEAMIWISKLVMRPNDTSKGRMIKVAHYIDLYKKFFGKLPNDLHLYIRNENEIPFNYKDEILKMLKEKGWKPKTIPDPTLLERNIKE